MAHKTFLSYKYSEACTLRDDIVDALGDDAKYYLGETSNSPDLTDSSTENIKEKLKNMIYGTTVTIVIVSPHMKESKWIDWEIEYALKSIKRGDRFSTTNGVLGVVMRYNGGFDWLRPSTTNSDGCSSISTKDEYLYNIISENRFNQEPKEYACDVCKTVAALTGSYISFVNEDDFLSEPNKYIDNAFDKSQKTSNYNLVKKK